MRFFLWLQLSFYQVKIQVFWLSIIFSSLAIWYNNLFCISLSSWLYNVNCMVWWFSDRFLSIHISHHWVSSFLMTLTAKICHFHLIILFSNSSLTSYILIVSLFMDPDYWSMCPSIFKLDFSNTTCFAQTVSSKGLYSFIWFFTDLLL